MMDLTTLEGKDTPGKVAYLCRKAIQPSCAPRRPHCAAVCVYPNLVRSARLFGPRACMSPRSRPSQRSERAAGEARRHPLAVAEGADEIDMVIDRGRFTRGIWRVFDEIAASESRGRRISR
jgi:deoxyribose-phosphate aldolase